MLAESALRAVYQAIWEGKYDLLTNLYGISDESILKLSNQNLAEREKLLQFAAQIMDVSINDGSLSQLIAYVHDYQNQQDLIDQFLLQGAQLSLMRKLFGVNSIAFTKRRKMLEIPPTRGRPPTCDEETELMILKLWERCSDIEPKLRYIQVAELTGQSICMIDTVLRRNELMTAEANPTPSAGDNP